MAAATDAELWGRACAGDGAAFGDLFERHARAIYNFAFRRTADWTLAEDLTATVFLEAWRRRAEVRLDGESALPWLYGVAANVLRNQRRSSRRRTSALGRLPGAGDAPDFADDVAGRLDDEREMARLLELLERLPAEEQDVLALCSWQSLSYREAALALGVPVGTVRSRLSRARGSLRELADGNGHVRVDTVDAVPRQGARHGR
jgi:RNA polymerase sigma factor (sigma-70 family)